MLGMTDLYQGSSTDGGAIEIFEQGCREAVKTFT